MTTEKAIDVLRGMELYLCSGNPIWKTDLIKEAVNMACEALRQVDTPQAEERCEKCVHFMTNDMGKIWCIGKKTCEKFEPKDTPLTDCGWGEPNE